MSSISSSELVKLDLFFFTFDRFTSDFFPPRGTNLGASVLGLPSLFLVMVLLEVTSVISETTDSLISGLLVWRVVLIVGVVAFVLALVGLVVFTGGFVVGLVVVLTVALVVGLVVLLTTLLTVFLRLTLDSVLVSTITDCFGGLGATLTSFSVALVSTSSAELRFLLLATNFLTGRTVFDSRSNSGSTSSFCSSMTGGTSLERPLDRLLTVVVSGPLRLLGLREGITSRVTLSGDLDSSVRRAAIPILLPLRERDGNSTDSADAMTEGPLVLASTVRDRTGWATVSAVAGPLVLASTFKLSVLRLVPL